MHIFDSPMILQTLAQDELSLLKQINPMIDCSNNNHYLMDGTDQSSGRKLPPNFSPGHYDVICGRGATAYNHIGNRRFRVTVSMYMKDYSQADSKLDKSLIVSSVVNGVRERSPHGGFVKKDVNTGGWFEVGDHLAREKVGQAFRDALHTRYRSSTKSKSKRKRAEKRESTRSSLTKSGLDKSTRASLDNMLEDMMSDDNGPDAETQRPTEEGYRDNTGSLSPLPFREPAMYDAANREGQPYHQV